LTFKPSNKQPTNKESFVKTLMLVGCIAAFEHNDYADLSGIIFNHKKVPNLLKNNR